MLVKFWHTSDYNSIREGEFCLLSKDWLQKHSYDGDAEIHLCMIVGPNFTDIKFWCDNNLGEYEKLNSAHGLLYNLPEEKIAELLLNVNEIYKPRDER